MPTPFENYTQLIADIEDQLMRDDLADTAAPRMIALAEAQLNREVMTALDMEETTTLAIDGQFSTLPADWAGTKTIQIQGGNRTQLHRMDAASMAARRQKNLDSTGEPLFYTHTDGQLEVWPTPDSTYNADLVYRIKIPALSDTQATNWVLLEHPDVYFYGALLHSAMYLEEDERLQGWATLYGAALTSFKRYCKRLKSTGKSMRRRVRGMG